MLSARPVSAPAPEASLASHPPLRALVIGGPGLVGGCLLRAFANRDQEALGTYHSRPRPGMVPLEMTDPDQVGACLAAYRPSVVFLAAALAAVDYCESHEDEAQRVNVGGARVVAEAANRAGAKLVFFSTEYVFDGVAGPYTEEDPPSPQGAYARSKLDAERAVQALAADHLIIRTTVVFDWDPDSKNFAMQLCDRLGSGQRMTVPNDQIGNPTLARYLADAAVQLVERDVRGIVNVVGRDRVARSEFAQRLAQRLGFDPALIEPAPTAALHQAAPRPLNAGLVTDKLARLLGQPPLDLDTAIARFAEARAAAQAP